MKIHTVIPTTALTCLLALILPLGGCGTSKFNGRTPHNVVNGRIDDNLYETGNANFRNLPQQQQFEMRAAWSATLTAAQGNMTSCCSQRGYGNCIAAQSAVQSMKEVCEWGVKTPCLTAVAIAKNTSTCAILYGPIGNNGGPWERGSSPWSSF